MSGGGGSILPMLGTAALGIAAPELLGALAPEFMASLGSAAPAIIGGVTGGLGAGVTGGNPLMGALTGGAGGAASGFLSGLLSDPGLPPGMETNPLDTMNEEGEGQALDPGGSQMSSGANASSSSVQLPGGAGNISGAKSSSGSFGGIDPLKAAGLGLGALGALFPTGSNPINIGGNANAVQNTSPGFNAQLPNYSYNSVKTPYTGSWYTYGERPESPMVTNTLTPPGSARGGLIKFANGGPVPQRKPPIPPAPSIPPMRNLSVVDVMAALPSGVLGQQATSTPSPADSSLSMTPSQRMKIMQSGSADFFDHRRGGPIRHFAAGGMMPKAANQGGQFQLGHALGQAMRRHIQGGAFSGSGGVRGPGGGQDDLVPARLSPGEYVHSADVVAALGDGSNDEGARKLKKMDAHVRAHKTSHGSKFPPKAKNPLAYVKK